MSSFNNLISHLTCSCSIVSGRKQFPQGSGDAPKVAAAKPAAAAADEDDDVDLFGSDEEDEEAERVKQERLAVSLLGLSLI